MSEKVKLIITLSKGQYENLKDIQFGGIGSRMIFNAVKNGMPLDNIDSNETKAYFDGQAYGWEEGRKALIEDLKAEIENDARDYRCDEFVDGLNHALEIIDNIGKEGEQMTERSNKDIIKDMREIVKPFISDCLKRVNYEKKGETDKAQFETEFEKVLTLAEKAETLSENAGEWIPVTEILPKDGQSVLFCDIDEDIMVGYHVKGRPVTHFSQDGTYEDMKNVRAWQPLPESYKGEN